MKRSLIASLAVVFLVLTATPASAQWEGTTCRTYMDGFGHNAKACTSVNQHDFNKWLQGLGDFNDQGDYVCIWVDTVKLYKNGSVIRTINGIAGCNYGWIGEPEYAEQTDWQHACTAGARYSAVLKWKIHWTSSTSSTWKTDTSNDFIPVLEECTA